MNIGFPVRLYVKNQVSHASWVIDVRKNIPFSNQTYLIYKLKLKLPPQLPLVDKII